MYTQYPDWMTQHAQTFVAVCEQYGHSVQYNDLAVALHGDDEGRRGWGYYLDFAQQFVLTI